MRERKLAFCYHYFTFNFHQFDCVNLDLQWFSILFNIRIDVLLHFCLFFYSVPSLFIEKFTCSWNETTNGWISLLCSRTARYWCRNCPVHAYSRRTFWIACDTYYEIYNFNRLLGLRILLIIYDTKLLLMKKNFIRVGDILVLVTAERVTMQLRCGGKFVWFCEQNSPHHKSERVAATGIQLTKLLRK